MNIYQKIIDVFGSQSALARKLDVAPMTVMQWKRRGKIPAERCQEIVSASNGKIALHELRPDIYLESSGESASRSQNRASTA